MNYKYIALSILLAAGVSACTDKFDEVNPNELTVEASYNTLSDTQKSLNAVYNTMYNDYLMSIEEMTICSDMGYPGYGRQGNPTNLTLAAYYNQTYTNSFKGVTEKWSALYTGIFRANQTIEGLEQLLNKGEEANEEWTTQMAQARFFRGLFHFYLHSVYNEGKIIIFDFVPKSDSDYHQSVSSAEDVMAFFRADLEYAYENLPASYGTKDERVTKGTAATILGTSYLYEEDYTNAITYLKDVITNSEYGYALASPDMLFTSAGEFNSESILEVNFQLGIHPEMSCWSYYAPTNRLGYTYGTQSFTLPCWITDAYQKEVMDPNSKANLISYTDEAGEKQDSLRSVSLRASAMIATIQDDNTPYYLNPHTSSVVKVNEKMGIGYYRKYTNWDIIDEEKNLPDGERKSGKNIILNRLSDVYLMYAECMLRKEAPDVEEALYYMNLIRDRWALELLGTPANNPSFGADKMYDEITYTAESLFKQLQDYDRPLELSAEGHAIRFIDLRRWGIAKTRFEELAGETYHLSSRVVPGIVKPKYKVWLQSGPCPEGKTFPELVDYTQAAANYDAALHGYWPIPLIEEQNNPNLFKNQ